MSDKPGDGFCVTALLSGVEAAAEDYDRRNPPRPGALGAVGHYHVLLVHNVVILAIWLLTLLLGTERLEPDVIARTGPVLMGLNGLYWIYRVLGGRSPI